MSTIRIRFKLICYSIVVIVWTIAIQSLVQGADRDQVRRLTLDRIFKSDEFHVQEAGRIQWCERRGGYTTLESPADKGAGRDLVWHDAAGERREIWVPAHRFVPRGEESPLAIDSYVFSRDESKLLIFTNTKRVWRTRSRGDYWSLDIAAGELKRLGGDFAHSTLMFGKFSPDGNQVAFVHENDLYVQDLQGMRITRLTHDGSATRANGTFDWVYEEELMLRDGYRWNADNRTIAYWQIDSDGVRTLPLVNNLAGLYPEIQFIPYPKVGERNPAARIGLVSVSGGPTRWLDLPGDPREHYVAQLDWVGDSRKLVLQQFNRLQNTNRLWVADAESLATRLILRETDAAWVDNSNATLHWHDNHRQLVWLSERDGWRHAFSVSLEDGDSKSGDSKSGEANSGKDNFGEARLITPGAFDVIRIDSVDSEGGWLYFTASPDNATQQYLYRVRLDGTSMEKVANQDRAGSHGYTIAPDHQWAIHRFSSFLEPPEVEMVRLPDGTSQRTLADNRALEKKLAQLARPKAEFFRVEIADGVALDGWCLKPPKFDKRKKYPVLFHVYGEPAGQTVLDRWGGRHLLWHWMLAQEGYVVMSVDNRGTPAPRGRDWRKIIYRQVGILASADQAAATRKLLQDRPYLDPSRVAIWGWSGGGSMTLNGLLRYPDLYHVGMSVAPVPNQRLYDTIYQERYMGLPGDNAEGYRLGSPLTFASQLQGKLLLVHGTGDDNCHYQGTEALIDELVAHNKPFSMFAYPGRSHSISEGKNTTRHLYGILTEFVHQHLPAGPLPRKK